VAGRLPTLQYYRLKILIDHVAPRRTTTLRAGPRGAGNAGGGGMMADEFSTDELRMLARVYNERTVAGQLLRSAGLDPTAIPMTSGTPMEYWGAVDTALRNGLLNDGRRRILELALDAYPANDVFIRGHAEATGSASGAAFGGAASGRAADLGGSASGGAASDRGSASGGAASDRGSAFGAGGGPRGAHSQQSVGDGPLPRPATVLVLDAVGYSPRGTLVQLAVRAGLRQIITDALADADIPLSAVRSQDRGDGYLAVISSDVAKALIGVRFVDELWRGLRRYNRTRNETGRIRLRLALHHGDVLDDGDGWAGTAVIVGCRLVDAPPIRRALNDHPAANLALIVSSAFYDDVVREQLLGIDPAEYQKVSVDVTKFQGDAWLTLPGLPNWWAEPAADTAVSTQAGPADGPVRGTLPDDAVKWDFLIAAADQDASWSEWIAFTLEKDNKYRAHVETWDIQAADSVVWQLQEAMEVAERTIVVVSAHLEVSSKAQAVWMNKWFTDPVGKGRTVVPVVIGDYEPKGLMSGIKPIRLRTDDAAAAEQELLSQIERTVAGRYRPRTQPPFPGMG
jgi:hypothetical protein